MSKIAFSREFLQSVNRIRVTKEDMLAVAKAREDEEIDHSLESTLHEVHEQHPDDQEKVQAIMFRMEALGRIVDERGLPGWASPPRSDGMVTLQEPVLAAAATVPLVLEGMELVFDYDRFLGKILDLADLEVQG